MDRFIANEKYSHQNEFEKWCAIRASVGGVGGVLAWVASQRTCVGGVSGVLAWVACQRGWRANLGYVDDMVGAPAWVRWLMCQCGRRTRVNSVSDIGGNIGSELDSVVVSALFLKLKTGRK